MRSKDGATPEKECLDKTFINETPKRAPTKVERSKGVKKTRAQSEDEADSAEEKKKAKENMKRASVKLQKLADAPTLPETVVVDKKDKVPTKEPPTPGLKRCLGIGKGQSNAYAQIVALISNGADRELVVAALHGIVNDAVPTRRRGKKVIEKATEVLLKLSNGSDEDDWQKTIEEYEEYLTKM